MLKKVHRVIKCYQKSWLKPYININTDIRKKAKNDFEKYIFKLMNNAIFGEKKTWKMWEKLVTTEARRKYLVSEPNFHTTFFFFFENSLAVEMKKLKCMWINLSI